MTTERRAAGDPADDRDDVIAFREEQAATLANITVARLRGWADRGLVGPSIRRTFSPRNTVRLYGFMDVEAVLMIVELHERGLSMQHIARIVEEHRTHYERPLTELRFDVVRGRVYIQHPDGRWDEDHQGVMHQVLMLEPIRARIRSAAAAGRAKANAGRVEQRRKVLHRAPVFAGTRVPVDTIREYLDAGVPYEEILEAFPSLSPLDLQLLAAPAATKALR